MADDGTAVYLTRELAAAVRQHRVESISPPAVKGTAGGSPVQPVECISSPAVKGKVGGSFVQPVECISPPAIKGKVGGSYAQPVECISPPAVEGKVGGSSAQPVECISPPAVDGKVGGGSAQPVECIPSPTVKGKVDGSSAQPVECISPPADHATAGAVSVQCAKSDDHLLPPQGTDLAVDDLILDEKDLRHELRLAVFDLALHWEDFSIVERVLGSCCAYPTGVLPSTAQWKRSSLSQLDHIRRVGLEQRYALGTMQTILSLARDLIQTLATRIATEHVRRAREPAVSAPVADVYTAREPTTGKARRPTAVASESVCKTLESTSPPGVAYEGAVAGVRSVQGVK